MIRIMRLFTCTEWKLMASPSVHRSIGCFYKSLGSQRPYSLFSGDRREPLSVLLNREEFNYRERKQTWLSFLISNWVIFLFYLVLYRWSHPPFLTIPQPCCRRFHSFVCIHDRFCQEQGSVGAATFLADWVGACCKKLDSLCRTKKKKWHL